MLDKTRLLQYGVTAGLGIMGCVTSKLVQKPEMEVISDDDDSKVKKLRKKLEKSEKKYNILINELTNMGVLKKTSDGELTINKVENDSKMPTPEGVEEYDIYYEVNDTLFGRDPVKLLNLENKIRDDIAEISTTVVISDENSEQLKSSTCTLVTRRMIACSAYYLMGDPQGCEYALGRFQKVSTSLIAGDSIKEVSSVVMSKLGATRVAGMLRHVNSYMNLIEDYINNWKASAS